jgi:phosphinothricin acetyltransferase
VASPLIRPAKHSDLCNLVALYNHYVRTSHISFDVDEYTESERLPWFESFSESGPHRLLIAEVSGQMAGYASCQEFRLKPAYAQSVETTIYLESSFIGKGVGFCLYLALLESLQSEESVHRAYAGIALPNPRSIKLHEKLGFKPLGTFHEVGFKFGQYWDVSWYEKELSAAAHAA